MQRSIVMIYLTVLVGVTYGCGPGLAALDQAIEEEEDLDEGLLEELLEGSGLDGSGLEGSGMEGSGLEGSGLDGSGLDGSGLIIDGSGFEIAVSLVDGIDENCLFINLDDFVCPKGGECIRAIESRGVRLCDGDDYALYLNDGDGPYVSIVCAWGNWYSSSGTSVNHRLSLDPSVYCKKLAAPEKI